MTPKTAAYARIVDAFLETEALPMSAQHDCPYLPGQLARCEGFSIHELDPEIYARLMDRNFRRSGRVIYRPVCRECTECRALRVPVHRFKPSRSQRRALKRNRDVGVTVGRPELTEEKWNLFLAYIDFQHDDTMSRDREDIVDFLYRPPVDGLEICYRLKDELVGVSIADRSADALSSVYMYFAPKHRRRSLGTYSALWEIDYCRRSGMTYYYLGYYVAGARTMAYKARFTPCEVLDSSHTWVEFQPPESG
ncbi:MAG TPA: arginyltransferase [Phycisphaerae bacterium]|nr:arginyltransferase [Phycisphaerae bacterium]